MRCCRILREKVAEKDSHINSLESALAIANSGHETHEKTAIEALKPVDPPLKREVCIPTTIITRPGTETYGENDQPAFNVTLVALKHLWDIL